MEIWDGYNADKTLAGVDIPRESENEGKYPVGLYHIVAEVIVRHTDGSYLVMQRDFNKQGHPGEWEIGAGGSVLKGESAQQGALRELYEETGIQADDLRLMAQTSVIHENGVGVHYYDYLCITDMDKDAVLLQEGETIDFKWISAEEILGGEYIPMRKLRVMQDMADMRLIVTERLLLRPLCMDDLHTVHLYASDVELTRYMMNLPNKDIHESRNFIAEAEAEWAKSAPEFYEYAVVYKGLHIGGVCLYLSDNGTKGELGWIISADCHGEGLATEAALSMVQLARKLGLEAVYARCDSRNAASQKLMQRLGMELVDGSGTRFYEKKQETAGELRYEMTL